MDEIDHTYWYLTRAAGMVAYLLAFASVCLGLLMTTDLVRRWLARNRVYDMHRFLSLLTLGLVVFHVLIVLPDAYFRFSLVQLLVPFASPYRPLYMGLGTLALYVLGIVVLSFYIRRLVDYRLWRLLHYATFGVFLLSLVHAVGAGTDTEFLWAKYVYVVTAVLVFNLGVYRVLKGSASGLPDRPSYDVNAPPPIAR